MEATMADTTMLGRMVKKRLGFLPTPVESLPAQVKHLEGPAILR